MSNSFKIPDAGMVTVEIGGQSHTIDCYAVYNELLAIRAKIAEEEKPLLEFHKEVVDCLKAKGLPELNHFQADRFITALQTAVAELGKA